MTIASDNAATFATTDRDLCVDWNLQVAVTKWILDLLNVQPGDELVDLYAGTGVMGRVAAARGDA